MTLFLCGGGSAEKTMLAYNRLNQMIDHHHLPILYVPFAMEKEQFQSCLDWFKTEIKAVSVSGIEMVEDGSMLSQKNLHKYAAVYIGGGNTFKLLKELKQAGCMDQINEYLQDGGIVFGGSAGAAIFGHDIDVVKYDDQNEVGLMDTSGFNLVNGFSIAAHYTNSDERTTQRITSFLENYSLTQKVLALPEEDTLLIDHHHFEILGNRPIYLFVNGKKEEIMNAYFE